MKPIAIKANLEDLAEILALQKLTFQSEAIIYDDDKLPPLTETLADIEADFYLKTILKIVENDKIIASGRGSFDHNIVHIERLSVHPDYQQRGLGTVLIETLENYFPNPEFFKLYTGFKSLNNLRWYRKLGYEVIGEKQYNEKLMLHFMMKKKRNALKIKVCGMRNSDNISNLTQLPINYIGFIFYTKSARYVSVVPEIINTKAFDTIKKVGVFVDADIDFVLEKIKKFNLNVVQLHGKEAPQYIEELRIKSVIARDEATKLRGIGASKDSSFIIHHSSLKLEIWKVFSVDDAFDFDETKPYEQLADKFLFDTKTPLHGGSGQKFDWDILKKYEGRTPFFLSGGISAADTEGVKNIRHPQFYGLDINSKFEISPAVKNVPLLETFISDVLSA
jgi:phosphoribosylanthranilate isomerase